MFKAVSEYICQKAGISIRSFPALLFPNSDLDEKTKAEIFPFAEINQQVLRQLGGDYAKLAEQLNPVGVIHELPLPEIKPFEFESAIITENETSINLEPFNFTFAKIKVKKSGFLRQTKKLSINKQQKQAHQFTENLGNGIQLEMVAIPGGSFMMGSPKNERGRRETESPQHQVTVRPFLLGKYPVTQAQWQAVAALPQVNQELKPNPSSFEGANRPVKRVSWHDAVEFCNRLSNHTQRPYRLPSEAEWEYACRAGTTTPFHFGETITTDLANYNGNYTYGDGVKGIRNGETTEVGSFKIANKFGLYDMHGNVWEWCQDDWHGNYTNAPSNSNTWTSRSGNLKMLRGGSWGSYPGDCRSASRYNHYLDNDDDNIGFRVVCSGAARTL
jgi:formylglycine-generating enzyme required for sulfatase activity